MLYSEAGIHLHASIFESLKFDSLLSQNLLSLLESATSLQLGTSLKYLLGTYSLLIY